MAFPLKFIETGTYGRHTTRAVMGVPAFYGMLAEVAGSARCRRGDTPSRPFARKLALARACDQLRRCLPAMVMAAETPERVGLLLQQHRCNIRRLWDEYFSVYEPLSLRGKAVIKAQQAVRQAEVDHSAQVREEHRRVGFAIGGPIAPQGADERR